ncbi:MAG: hypothetical protein CMJ58_23835 [Planctomycetaceae bacterium]|nr:hypothetical protein [Planctomycetaceae bacterium]
MYFLRVQLPRKAISAGWLTIFLAGVIGLGTGYGAALFTAMIHWIRDLTINAANDQAAANPWLAGAAITVIPAIGLVIVSWMCDKYAPEAAGHGIPEVITALARNDGRIRPQVAVIKSLSSALCIGTGGSVGREGPIVQVGSALGSTAGQLFHLSARDVKLLVAAGGAAGISATFNAPLAGVIFSSEILLGSFAIESMTPVVVASVLADVVQKQIGEYGSEPAFRHIDFSFPTALSYLPPYLILGLVAGVMAVSFTKLLYAVEAVSLRWFPSWWKRALVLGVTVGLIGALTNVLPPNRSDETQARVAAAANGDHVPAEGAAEGEEIHRVHPIPPPLLGSGYEVIDHSLHLQLEAPDDLEEGAVDNGEARKKQVVVARSQMWHELLWLLPLVVLKPLMTSLTLAGGGSGGIFAPSLYIGATLGAVFGLLINLIAPSYAVDPGVYAIVGMGAVVAGTTHGTLSAILIVYEMTNNYMIILPIMITAGLASLVAGLIDPDSIYYKKLTLRGEHLRRGHDLHRLDHVMVRDVMIREFPTLPLGANVHDIIRVARDNPHIESLPVMDPEGKLIGIIRPSDLHRVLDSDVSPHLVNAMDIALRSPLSVSPSENLIEALRDFGTRDVETLPVEVGKGEARRLVGLLLRSDVMNRYRQEVLARH